MNPPCAEVLIHAHKRLGGSILALQEVPRNEVGCYGMVVGKEIDDGVIQVEDMRSGMRQWAVESGRGSRKSVARTAGCAGSLCISKTIEIIGPTSSHRGHESSRSVRAGGMALALLRHQFRKGLAVVRAAHVLIERTSAFAHPADALRGDASDQRVRWDIFRHDGAGSDHGASSDREATENRGICADGGSVLDGCWHHVPVRVHSPRVGVIRKADVRANENAIADPQALVKGGKVLDLAAVPDRHIGIDVHVFPNVAILPDASSLSNLGPVPDRRTVADLRLGGYLGRGMDSKGHAVRAGDDARV